MKYLKRFDKMNEGLFDKFSKNPNEKWSDSKLKNYLKRSAWDKFKEMGIPEDESITPEGKKYEPIIAELIEDIYPFLSDSKKEELLNWYMGENFFYKTEEPSEFEIGDEVYYYFNPIEKFEGKPNLPKYYKDVVKSKSVGQNSWKYNFEKNRHDNTNEDGTVSRSGQYASMVEEEDIDYSLDNLKQKVSKRLTGDVDVIGE